MQEVLTSPGSPWQNAYVERFIGSVRRECLDHVIVLTAAGLRRILNEYVAYYSVTRTHLRLDKDAPLPRRVAPLTAGRVIAIPQVGGLHHRYERAASRHALPLFAMACGVHLRPFSDSRMTVEAALQFKRE